MLPLTILFEATQTPLLLSLILSSTLCSFPQKKQAPNQTWILIQVLILMIVFCFHLFEFNLDKATCDLNPSAKGDHAWSQTMMYFWSIPIPQH